MASTASAYILSAEGNGQPLTFRTALIAANLFWISVLPGKPGQTLFKISVWCDAAQPATRVSVFVDRRQVHCGAGRCPAKEFHVRRSLIFQGDRCSTVAL